MDALPHASEGMRPASPKNNILCCLICWCYLRCLLSTTWEWNRLIANRAESKIPFQVFVGCAGVCTVHGWQWASPAPTEWASFWVWGSQWVNRFGVQSDPLWLLLGKGHPGLGPFQCSKPGAYEDLVFVFSYIYHWLLQQIPCHGPSQGHSVLNIYTLWVLAFWKNMMFVERTVGIRTWVFHLAYDDYWSDNFIIHQYPRDLSPMSLSGLERRPTQNGKRSSLRSRTTFWKWDRPVVQLWIATCAGDRRPNQKILGPLQHQDWAGVPCPVVGWPDLWPWLESTPVWFWWQVSGLNQNWSKMVQTIETLKISISIPSTNSDGWYWVIVLQFKRLVPSWYWWRYCTISQWWSLGNPTHNIWQLVLGNSSIQTVTIMLLMEIL